MSTATLRHAAFVLRGNPLTAIAAFATGLLVLVALFGPMLVPYDPIASDVAHALEARAPPTGRARTSWVATSSAASSWRRGWISPSPPRRWCSPSRSAR